MNRTIRILVTSYIDDGVESGFFTFEDSAEVEGLRCNMAAQFRIESRRGRDRYGRTLPAQFAEHVPTFTATFGSGTVFGADGVYGLPCISGCGVRIHPADLARAKALAYGIPQFSTHECRTEEHGGEGHPLSAGNEPGGDVREASTKATPNLAEVAA